jgi:hypothetical protein
LPSVSQKRVLIPRPRINLIFYHGVLAPHCQLASTYGLCSLRACLRGGMCHGPERTIEAVATGVVLLLALGGRCPSMLLPRVSSPGPPT